MNYEEVLRDNKNKNSLSDVSVERDSAKSYKKLMLSPNTNPFQLWDEYKIRSIELLQFGDFDHLK